MSPALQLPSATSWCFCVEDVRGSDFELCACLPKTTPSLTPASGPLRPAEGCSSTKQGLGHFRAGAYCMRVRRVYRSICICLPVEKCMCKCTSSYNMGLCAYMHGYMRARVLYNASMRCTCMCALELAFGSMPPIRQRGRRHHPQRLGPSGCARAWVELS